MKIQSTVYPQKPLSEAEWLKEFKVGTNVPKYDGIDRARMMMNQWLKEGNGDGFKWIIDDLELRGSSM